MMLSTNINNNWFARKYYFDNLNELYPICLKINKYKTISTTKVRIFAFGNHTYYGNKINISTRTRSTNQILSSYAQFLSLYENYNSDDEMSLNSIFIEIWCANQDDSTNIRNLIMEPQIKLLTYSKVLLLGYNENLCSDSNDVLYMNSGLPDWVNNIRNNKHLIKVINLINSLDLETKYANRNKINSSLRYYYNKYK